MDQLGSIIAGFPDCCAPPEIDKVGKQLPHINRT